MTFTGPLPRVVSLVRYFRAKLKCRRTLDNRQAGTYFHWMLLQTLFLGATAVAAVSQSTGEAPGSPGIRHLWAPAYKQAIGAAPPTSPSPVWFTVAEGIVSEIFYPTVDTPQIADLQFLVASAGSRKGEEDRFFSDPKSDVDARVSYNGGMGVTIESRHRDGAFEATQRIAVDPARPVLRIQFKFRPRRSGLSVYLLVKPALEGNSTYDCAWTEPGSLQVREGDMTAAVVSNTPWTEASAGFVGVSDGWQDLSRNYRLTHSWSSACGGNVALTANLGRAEGEQTFEIALGLGPSARSIAQESLALTSFDEIDAHSQTGWQGYLADAAAHDPVSAVLIARDPLFRKSLALLKMHEDKGKPGAMVASFSKPAVPDGIRAGDGTPGYHLIWPRDLYHSAMGLMAAGDPRTARSVLDYYASTQKPDGSWWQNFFVDGRPHWQGLQMDQVAVPILLAQALQARKVLELGPTQIKMVKAAADFLVGRGPSTVQERWEENSGYSPSTLAAEIAGLRAATRILGDPRYAQVADEWRSKLAEWTVVAEGQWGRNYFLRISPQGWASLPREEWFELANHAGWARASDILDGGFLELVRLGILPASDANITNTLRILDDPWNGVAAEQGAAKGTPAALLYKRYHRDGYGPRGVGGYWPLLSGERGVYAVAAGDFERARLQLRAMATSATEAGMIPEQIPVSAKLSPLGTACPLAWAHAEYLVLARSIYEERVFDQP